MDIKKVTKLLQAPLFTYSNVNPANKQQMHLTYLKLDTEILHLMENHFRDGIAMYFFNLSLAYHFKN